MSDQNNQNFTHESQKQRWVKYGANVLAASVLVVVLAGLLTWAASGTGLRKDMTASGDNSLKPQSVNLLGDLHQKIRLVSLYSRGEAGSEQAGYAQKVADLLDEYRSKSSNIDVEIIDPSKNPSKVDSLIEDVTTKYGGEIKKYKAFLDGYAKQFDQFKGMAKQEAEKVSALPLNLIESQELAQTAMLTIATVQDFPKKLEEIQDKVKRRQTLKPPDYKGATDIVQESMESLSALLGQITSDFDALKTDSKVPGPIRAYMGESVGRYKQMKTLADGLVKQVKDLGALKLDELRQSLRAKDAILVMGETDMRVLPADQVWQASGADVKRYMQGEKIKPRFAGEQQISTAIYQLINPKKIKVVFCRNGGAPLASAGMPPYQEGGPLSKIAARLRQYNFEVMEKDLTGMYEMQAQMQQRPVPPEPSFEEIKDAIWVVLSFPAGQNPMGMPPQSIEPKLMEHLKNKGSALVIFAPNGDNLRLSLKEWGVDVKTDTVIVHEKIKPGDKQSGDYLEEAKRLPFMFDIREYGDHMLTKPLRSLASSLVPLLAVNVTQQKGYIGTPIIPTPADMKAWGTTDIAALEQGDDVKFDAKKGDVAGTMYAGAAVENEKDRNRVVVIASPMFIMDRFLDAPDPELLKQGVLVARFPGNADLFTNAIFWLAKQETMIAISPSAMEVGRIDSMSPAAMNFWHNGVLLVGLPMLVILAGVWMYFARRD